MAFYTNWDCTECKTPNRNDEHYCGKCGTKKPRDPKYYLPENPEVVTDEDDLRMTEIDVCICGNCDMHNPVTRDFCLDCGHVMTHQLDDIHEATFQGASEDEIVAEGDIEIDTSHDERYDDRNGKYVHDEFESKFVPDEEITNEEEEPRSYNINYIIYIGCVLILMALVYVLFADKHVDVKVQSFNWSSERVVEEYKTFKESGWNRPRTAYDVTSRREYHHSEDSLTHYETVHYTVREVVDQEPYQESYTVEVACGQESYEDCRYVTKQCGTKQESYTERVLCGTKINSNGYAETTYCNETRYRSVPDYCQERECDTKYRTKYCDETRYRTKYRDVMGDVAKTRQEPRYVNVKKYATKYYYTIDRWTVINSAKLSGNDRDFKEVPNKTKGKIRMSEAVNVFGVIFKDINSNDIYRKEYKKKYWENLKKNHVYDAIVNNVGKFEIQAE